MKNSTGFLLRVAMACKRFKQQHQAQRTDYERLAQANETLRFFAGALLLSLPALFAAVLSEDCRFAFFLDLLFFCDLWANISFFAASYNEILLSV